MPMYHIHVETLGTATCEVEAAARRSSRCPSASPPLTPRPSTPLASRRGARWCKDYDMADRIDDFRNRPQEAAADKAWGIMFDMHDCLDIEAVLGDEAAERLRARMAEAILMAYQRGREDQREDTRRIIAEKLGL